MFRAHALAVSNRQTELGRLHCDRRIIDASQANRPHFDSRQLAAMLPGYNRPNFCEMIAASPFQE